MKREHLYRRHRVPIQCKRCWLNFKSQSALDDHLTVTNICPITEGTPAEGVTVDIEKRLRSRKKTAPGQSEEDRWREIYTLLFPDEAVPVPCRSIIILTHMSPLLPKAPKVRRDTRNTALTRSTDFDPVCEESAPSPDTRELEDYEEYSRQELPRLVRSSLESVVNEQTQPLEEHLRSQLLTIIQDCQDKMFSAYRSKRARSSEDSLGAMQPPKKRAKVMQSNVQGATSDIVSSVFQPVPHSIRGPDLTFVRDASIQLNRQTRGYEMVEVLSDSGYATQPWDCICIGICSCPRSELVYGDTTFGGDLAFGDRMY